MDEPLAFYSAYLRKSAWRFPIAPLTARSRASIDACARCPECRVRVTLDEEVCKRGHRYVKQDRTFGRFATLDVPFDVSEEIHRYHIRRERTWRAKRFRKEMLAFAGGKHTKHDIRLLYDAQHGCCYYCGKPLGAFGTRGAFHVDHLLAIVDGGDQWPDNLALACAFCNQSKGAMGEHAMWASLRKSRDSAWVARRRKALGPIRKLRREIDLARRLAADSN